jgi:two-component system phosphate regulon sensor histidine kinase PhoR
MLTQESIVIVTPETQINMLLQRILSAFGMSVEVLDNSAALESYILEHTPVVAILGENLVEGGPWTVAAQVLQRLPLCSVILLVRQETNEVLKQSLQIGIDEVLCLPLRADQVTQVVKSGMEKGRMRRAWFAGQMKKDTASLLRKVDESEALVRLGRTINSSLDMNSVLTAVVAAAVQMTGSEEGSLLLVDEASGELYMHAARNFQDEFVRTFRLPIQDSLAGQVVTSGKPVLLDQDSPQKIKTSYLVHSLVYVPLEINGRVFGVLGVDNRMRRSSFTEHDLHLLQALAEFAIIGIQNARNYDFIDQRRNELETILAKIQDGVIVLDKDERLLIANQSARAALYNSSEPGCESLEVIEGRPFGEIFSQPELVELVESTHRKVLSRIEVTVEDGRVFNAKITPIPEMGVAITLNDITYLKKLDRIKTDFVQIISHDLRSPLTAILGYAELVERVGTLNDIQKDFIRRVQVSVHNITALVDDLLSLGRIESGFDTRKERLQIDQIIRYAADGFNNKINDKEISLNVELAEILPPIYANAVHMRQMVEHLIDNAIKYTRREGTLTIAGEMSGNQIVLKFSDNGIGIPPLDIPYIFEKFYRASNASGEVTGTGLGLSIVRSFVENHEGRIWVESSVDHGTTFTIILPVAES